MTINLIGWGGYLPSKKITNEDLEKVLDTSDSWIRERTGIHQRFVATEEEKTSHLAFRASEQALSKAGISPDEIDLIILATTTPDDIFPATAVRLQSLLGAKKAVAFDVQAVCSGFLFALSTAEKFLESGVYKTALVVGAETMSKILDWKDRSTAVLFGDGAGAWILRKDAGGDCRRLLSTHIFSDGDHCGSLSASYGNENSRGFLVMNGREVFKYAIQKMVHSVNVLLEHHHLSVAEVDWMIPHQANIRIIDRVAEHFQIPLERVARTVHKHANTSAATIPLAWTEMESQFRRHDRIVLTAMGGGFTWGSALLQG